MLDTSATFSMTPPTRIPDHPTATKRGRAKLVYATIAGICEDAAMTLAVRLDG